MRIVLASLVALLALPARADPRVRRHAFVQRRQHHESRGVLPRGAAGGPPLDQHGDDAAFGLPLPQPGDRRPRQRYPL
jgi:hypothetical protein